MNFIKRFFAFYFLIFVFTKITLIHANTRLCSPSESKSIDLSFQRMPEEDLICRIYLLDPIHSNSKFCQRCKSWATHLLKELPNCRDINELGYINHYQVIQNAINQCHSSNIQFQLRSSTTSAPKCTETQYQKVMIAITSEEFKSCNKALKQDVTKTACQICQPIINMNFNSIPDCYFISNKGEPLNSYRIFSKLNEQCNDKFGSNWGSSDGSTSNSNDGSGSNDSQNEGECTASQVTTLHKIVKSNAFQQCSNAVDNGLNKKSCSKCQSLISMTNEMPKCYIVNNKGKKVNVYNLILTIGKSCEKKFGSNLGSSDGSSSNMNDLEQCSNPQLQELSQLLNSNVGKTCVKAIQVNLKENNDVMTKTSCSECKGLFLRVADFPYCYQMQDGKQIILKNAVQKWIRQCSKFDKDNGNSKNGSNDGGNNGNELDLSDGLDIDDENDGGIGGFLPNDPKENAKSISYNSVLIMTCLFILQMFI